jgi:MinD-like ATPase involved in chromosome partitioning or flagellar assembly
MSFVVAFLTTKDGQGSTTLALATAWAAAQQHRVMFIDADMSGTGSAADALALDIGGRSIGNLFGTQSVSAAMLDQQALQVRGRSRLRVVPGLQGFCGPGVAELLPRLRPALISLADELVVLDLGSPLAHPRLDSARQTAETICALAGRVFIVLQDSPARLVRSIQVLKSAQMPQAEIILCETRRGVLREQVTKTLKEHLPGVVVVGTVPWDPKLAARSEDLAVPMQFSDLLRNLQVTAVLKQARKSA